MKNGYKLLLLMIFILVFSGGILGAYLGHKQSLEIEKLENSIIENKLTREEVRLLEDKEDPKIETKKSEEISIIAAGDIMFHMPQVKGAYKNGSYDFKNSFKYIKDILAEGDLKIANLETTTAGKNLGYSGYPRFNSPDEVVRDIKDCGFNLLNINNNHSLDKGKQGLISTIDNLNRNEIKYIGANYENQDKYIIEEIRGVRLGILSYSYGYNGLEGNYSKSELASVINKLDEKKVKEDIDFIKGKVDMVIVYVHWGNEYKTEPSDNQVNWAEKMMSFGADIILGSHPHVVQKSDKINQDGKNKYVVYSMGNFISNQNYQSTKSNYVKDGLMVKLVLEKDFETGRVDIKNIDYIPTWTYKYNLNGRTNHEIIPIEKALNGEIKIYNKDVVELELKNSYNRTMGIINKN